MPKLKKLVCQVLWANTGTPFREYATCYGDGVVETFIVVPDKPQIFSIRLTSTDFIYEGLSAAIFMDGHYQCNRNRVNLLPARKGVARDRTEINFLFRQKEKSLGNGMFMGREWRFDDHNIVPTLPEGVAISHFDDIGEIEVLVRRCSAKNVEHTNASTTSSAAESDIGEDGKHEDDKIEDEDERDEDIDTRAKETAAQKYDEPLPFTALFDGPADYRRYSQSPGRGTFGDWKWSSQPAFHRQHEGCNTTCEAPPFDRSHKPFYHGSSYPYSTDSHFDHQHRSDPPPNYEYPSRSEKRVHFDHGQNQGPSADPNRYWDGHPAPDLPPRGWFTPHHGYQAQGLSESQQARYSGMPRHSFSHQAHSVGDGRPAPPHVHYHEPQAPSHLSVPTFQSQYSTHPQGQTPHRSHASPIIPPSGSHAPPEQHWCPYPIYVVPHTTHPHYFDGYHSHYPPYAGMPVPPTATDGNAGDAANQKLGGLDPAKDRNNPNDGTWPTQNDSNPNQENSTNVQGDWNVDGKENNQNNENGNNDSGNGENYNKSGSQNGNSWDNNESQQNNDNRTDSGSQPNGNNQAWENDGGHQNNNSNGETSNQNDNAQGNWSTTDKSVNGPDSGNEWEKKSTNATEGTASISARSAERSLYGPHGTYYNVRPSGVLEPPCDAEEEPRYDVPQSYVDECGSRKQVQPGKGYRYYKKPCRLNYVDTLDEPYARFVFKYRTKEELKHEVGIEVDTEPSGNEEVQALQDMGKDELIRMLIRAQSALGGKIPSPPPQAPDPATDASFKGVAVDPPSRSFLEYKLPPNRGGNSNAPAVEGSLSGKGGNDAWESAPADNDSNTNQNDNTSNAKAWDSGGNEWEKGNNSNTQSINW